jgi:hypothetical protein
MGYAFPGNRRGLCTPSAALLLAASALMGVAVDAAAQAQCGFTDRLFRARFERTDQPGVSLPAGGIPVAISFDVRYAGAITSQASLPVYGTYAGPPLTGVSVNGIPARRHGQAWLVDALPLQPGTNTVTATATRLTGQTVQASVTINRTGPTPGAVEVVAENVQQYAPGRGAVTVRVTGGTNRRLVSARIDQDGDGTPEQDLPGSGDGLRAVIELNQPGLHLVQVSGETDDDDPSTPPTSFLQVVPVLTEHTGMARLEFCAVFDHMKSRLQAGNINGALHALHPRLHDRFRTLWQGLGADLGPVAAGLGQVADGTIGHDGAELLIARPGSAPGALEGFPIRAAQGADGVWRIEEM